MNYQKLPIVTLSVWVALSASLAFGQFAKKPDPTTPSPRLTRELQHELAMLPWYGVFDWIESSISPDGRVTLRGWVTRPTTKEDAENRVKEIEGVPAVTNEIRVLPLSPSDDRLRRSLYVALFDYDSPLFRYALGANPSIHIIVENGRVVLKGMVTSKVERELAFTRANAVSGIFEVRNDLMIDPASRGE